MNTIIHYKNTFKHKVNPNHPPKDTRELDSFLYANGASKCFLKGQGGWYKVTPQGKILYVVRTLYLLSLLEWLEIALDENYIPNIKH